MPTEHVPGDPDPASSDQLVLAHGTVRHASFTDRVAAARDAGYAGIGLSARGYAALREQGLSDRALRTMLDDHGVALTETEGLLGFDATGVVADGVLAGRVYSDPVALAQVFAMADALGVRHLNVTAGFSTSSTQGPAATARLAACFAALCDRAAGHGLAVALEHLPGTTVPDVTTAVAVVADADRPNGGLCLDVWHHVRGGGTDEALATVPAEKVLVVQLDDGPRLPVDPDYLTDTMHHRQLPGDGELDPAGFVRRLLAAGVRAPVSVEVLSDRLDRLSPHDAADRAATATRSVLAAARAACADRVPGGAW